MNGNQKGRGSAERLAELTAAARAELSACRLCPWECGADRTRGQVGRCGAGAEGRVFYAGLLVNEEPDLNPCYEVFFTGCSLDCGFCYLRDSVRRLPGCRPALPLSDHPLFDDPALGFARSVAAIGGEPSVNLPATLDLFSRAPAGPLRVWNSNMYYAGLAAEAAAEAADVVVADIHFGHDGCAARVAGVNNYMDTVAANIRRAADAGLSVIVRHLPLPGHARCCGLPAVRLMAERFGDLRLHLLDNYLPPSASAVCPELAAPVARADFELLLDEARRLGLRLDNDAAPVGPRPAADPGFAETGEVLIDAGGRIIVPHLTPGLAALLAGMEKIEVTEAT